MQQNRKIRNILLTVITILLVATAGVSFLYFFQKPVVTIRESARFPIGEKVKLYDLVLGVEHGTLKSEDVYLDSQTAGTRQVTILVEDLLGNIQEKKFVIEFYDDIPPTITAPDSVTVTKGEETNLLEGVEAVDDNGDICEVTLSGSYDFNIPGTYELYFLASDRTGNAAQKKFVLTVLATPFDEEGNLIDGTYTTKNGFQMVIKDGITTVDGFLVVNKSYSIPKDYPTKALTTETMKAFSAMQSGALADGITLTVRSGYRSWYDQSYIYNNYVATDGFEEAETFSARPGHSEHQTGLGMDIVTSSSEDVKTPRIAAIMEWLNQNAYRYGFVLRYPEGKTDETGYIYEPWHYRYVGTELAETLYNNGDWITMEDYFGIDSAYKSN